jgi:hypothetical protein
MQEMEPFPQSVTKSTFVEFIPFVPNFPLPPIATSNPELFRKVF